ncbi:unnamed protein product [Cochlearia groenlandica]
MASSSLPRFYGDFTTSSSQLHASSSCPDVSSLSNYIEDYTSSCQDSIFLPQLYGISDDVYVQEYNPYNYQRMGVNNNATTQYFHGGDHQEYYGFSQEVKPLFHPPIGEQSWGNSEGLMIQTESNTKVGRYTVEERKDRIMRYLKKKNQRNFNKTIKYVCRKTLADRRVRVRGRFARNNDTCDQQQQSPLSKNHHNNNNHSQKDYEDMFSGSDDYLIQQMENDDGWLQEAMSGLISFPCELEVPPGDTHNPNTWTF